MLANHDARTETETTRKELRYHSWILQYIILFEYVLHQLLVERKKPKQTSKWCSDLYLYVWYKIQGNVEQGEI